MKLGSLWALFLPLSACLNPNDDGNLVPKTVDENPSLPAVEVNGTKLHLETFGDPAKPVVFMLHGGPCVDYRGMLGLHETAVDGVRLEDEHLVVYFDQRSCGLSRRHDENQITRALYEGDLLALIDEYSPGRPVVLIGHSWGGMYLSGFIGNHPDRVAGAVLMDSGPLTGKLFEEVKGGISHLDYFSEWLNDTAFAETIVSPEGHARRDYILLLGSLGDSQPNYHLPHPREPVWRLGAVGNQALQKEGMKNGEAAWDFTTGLHDYPKKVLFIGAGNDEVLGIDFQRRQMKLYPNADIVEVPGAGHEFPYTHPDATLRPILQYLAGIGF